MFYHLILTTECNGECAYCHKKSLDDMEDSPSHEYDYDVPESVSYDVRCLESFISGDADPTLTFYGGEPLLRTDVLRQVMDSIRARFMLQTNGLLLHELPAAYANRFHTILVSLDGDEKTTDRLRGKGDFGKVMANVSLLKKNGFRGELIARMTIEDQDIYESVTFLLENFSSSVHWQLDANFWRHDYATRDFAGFAAKSYNPGIAGLADYWILQMREGRVLKLYPFLDIAEDMLLRRRTKLRCGSGHSNFTVQTDGRIVPCPIMAGMKKFYLGDIRSASPDSLPGMMASRYEWRPPCKGCGILHICGGRCLYSNFLQPWGAKGMDEVCGTVRFLVKTLESKLPEMRKLIADGVISTGDFGHVKYNGCEIIP